MSNPGVSLEADADCLCIGNDLLQLTFALAEGGCLQSVLDRRTGYEFCRDPSAPRLLYRLGILPAEGHEVRWTDSRSAASLDWTWEEQDEGATLALRSAHRDPDQLEVTVRVRLAAGSSLTRWRVEVCNGGGDSVYQLTCPILSGVARVGDPTPGECLVFPVQGEGYLFREPFPVCDHLPLCAGAGPEAPEVGVGRLHGHYPGRIPLQMMAYYNDHAGLYLATHDPRQHVKTFEVAPLPGASEAPAFAISHLPETAPGRDLALDYDTIVGVFHGDWYDAADLYKAWATQQWWCEKKLAERDIPDWLRRGFGVFQTSNYQIPQLRLNHPMSEIAEQVNELSEEAGVPLLALIFNWEGSGAWTGPVGFFPPREGEDAFRAAMRRLRNAGNYGFVYITGGCWYLRLPYDPPFDSWDAFEREGRPYAVRDLRGEAPIGRWYPGWESTRLCPWPEYTRRLTVSVVLRCLDLGCTVVQIDNFPCGGAEACYDPTHGHPLGYGPWWSQAWGELLAEARRQARARNPECAITTEGISEAFIPHLDLFDHRAGNMEYFGHYQRGMPMGGETIPLFNYVYGEYLGAYCAAMPECNRPEVLYWTRCLGKALTQGVVPTGGRYFPEPRELNPVTIGFYRRVLRAARDAWPYLMFGEMLRPPDLEVPAIMASYCKFVLDEQRHHVDPRQRHEVWDRAVQHAVWRGPDGSLGYLFANVSQETISFHAGLSAHDLEDACRVASSVQARTYDLEQVVEGVRTAWLTGVELPRREEIVLEPLSVLLITVRPHEGDR